MRKLDFASLYCLAFVCFSLLLSIANSPLYATSRIFSTTLRNANAITTHLPLVQQLQLAYPYRRFDNSKIPTIIWQTWKEDVSKLDSSLRPLEATWSERHPSHIHLVLDNTKADDLIKSLYASIPSVYEAYSSMVTDIHRADFFRYLILFALGGTYSDIDTRSLRPVWEWFPQENHIALEKQIGLVIGIEADPVRPDWAQWYSRRVQICQWTIRAKSGHPILANMISKVVQKTLQMKRTHLLDLNNPKLLKSTMEFTGPGVWTDAIMEYLNEPQHFTKEDKKNVLPIRLGKQVKAIDLSGMDTHKIFGDVMLLPITSFSPGINHMGSKPLDDPMAFVFHSFLGSWKEEGKTS